MESAGRTQFQVQIDPVKRESPGRRKMGIPGRLLTSVIRQSCSRAETLLETGGIEARGSEPCRWVWRMDGPLRRGPIRSGGSRPPARLAGGELRTSSWPERGVPSLGRSAAARRPTSRKQIPGKASRGRRGRSQDRRNEGTGRRTPPGGTRARTGPEGFDRGWGLERRARRTDRRNYRERARRGIEPPPWKR